MRYFLLCCLLFTLSACSSGGDRTTPNPPTASIATQRTIAQGELIGFVADNGAHVWRGIPFAADTGGENRWRAPRPHEGWDGLREALAFGPPCPQIANDFSQFDFAFEQGDLVGDEACLNLDIYAPANIQDEDLPVMVWIHGGSNVSGASQIYQGHNLAANERVIIVVVQYRLGPLGWFAHETLRETAKTERDRGANFGTLDLIAALEWVQGNIEAFGGDAGNVTIFGESAGGHNVATLLASPLSKGLFHKAILQSGGFDSVTLAEAEGRAGDEPNPSSEVAARLGVANFQSATTQDVFDAYELQGGYMELPRVIQDGVVLPITPLRAAFTNTETFHTVPIITGINRDEMKLFNVLDPRFTKRRFGRFIVTRDQDFYDAASDYLSRAWRIRSVDLPAQAMAAAGHQDVYAYRFDWDEGGKILWTDLSKLLGAAHSVEIPFVFNRFELFGDVNGLMFQKKTLETRQSLSRTMGRYWANFARTGEPSADTAPDWPGYGAGEPRLIRFDSQNDGGIQLISGADSFGALYQDLSADGRIDLDQKCQIAVALAEWSDIAPKREASAGPNCG